jgi:small subunit ribosomal protein S20
MANTRSAAKQARKAIKRRTLNRQTKDAVRTATKKIKTLVKEGHQEEALKFFTEFQSTVDKAAKTKRIHKNTASRRKSRLVKLIKTGPVAAVKKAAKKNTSQIKTKTKAKLKPMK